MKGVATRILQVQLTENLYYLKIVGMIASVLD